jgi:Tfp pilus assembly protein PilN
MSVRVNLLPEATKQRDRAAHQRSLAALVGVVFLAGLGGVYLWQSSQVSQAEDQLAAEQTRTSELRGDQAELIAFQELADRRDRSDDILMTALSDEVSLAGVLQDIAAVMPTDTQLETVAFSIATVDDPAVTGVGTLSLTGKTLTAHAPGVERVLLSLDKIVSFREAYLNSSTLDEDDGRIATFSLDGQIGVEAETGRYAHGIPEALR